MEFSKRERFLIGLLVFTVAWALLFRLLFLPSFEKLMLYRQQLEQMENEKAQLDLFVGQAQAGEDEEYSFTEEGEENAGFFDNGSSGFADRMLQEMAAQAGVEILVMEIGEPKKWEEEAGVPETDPRNTVSGRRRKTLFERTLSLKIECGSFSQAVKLADEIGQRSPGMLVKSLDLEGGERQENGEKQKISGRMEVGYYYVQDR